MKEGNDIQTPSLCIVTEGKKNEIIPIESIKHRREEA
jgi:hypothetical protein